MQKYINKKKTRTMLKNIASLSTQILFVITLNHEREK